MRAYCVALSAAITVIVASWLGLPVSSTHIAVGGVFGVGFFREWHQERRTRTRAQTKSNTALAAAERRRRKLVRRSHFLTVVAAWVITVPAAALLSAAVFWFLNMAFT
jgi:PiT family inorganic phosphate transporter